MSHLLEFLRARSAASPDTREPSGPAAAPAASTHDPQLSAVYERLADPPGGLASRDSFESKTWTFGNGSRVTVRKSRSAEAGGVSPLVASRGSLLRELTRQLPGALIPYGSSHYSLSGEPAVLWPGSEVIDTTDR